MLTSLPNKFLLNKHHYDGDNDWVNSQEKVVIYNFYFLEKYLQLSQGISWH